MVETIVPSTLGFLGHRAFCTFLLLLPFSVGEAFSSSCQVRKCFPFLEAFPLWTSLTLSPGPLLPDLASYWLVSGHVSLPTAAKGQVGPSIRGQREQLKCPGSTTFALGRNASFSMKGPVKRKHGNGVICSSTPNLSPGCRHHIGCYVKHFRA